MGIIDRKNSVEKDCLCSFNFKKILTIAVTGSAGSGKSLVCQLFKKLGLVVLDCDSIARQVVAPGKSAYIEIVNLFGQEIVLSNEYINRSAIRDRIINDSILRKKLENILHPVILDTLFDEIKKAEYTKEKACAVEVPLLFELGLENKFDIVLTIAGNRDQLINRIVSRDGVSLDSANRILDIQMEQNEKIRRSKYVLYNRGSIEDLFNKVFLFYNQIKKNY